MDEGNTTNSHDNARSQLWVRFEAARSATSPNLPFRFRGHILIHEGIQWCIVGDQKFEVLVRGASKREFLLEEEFRWAGFGSDGLVNLKSSTVRKEQQEAERRRRQEKEEKDRRDRFIERRVQEAGARVRQAQLEARENVLSVAFAPVPRSRNSLINKGVKPRRQGIMFSEAAMPDQRFTGGWAEVVSAWLEPEFRTLAEAAMSRMGWREVQRFLQESSEWPPEIQEFVMIRASRLGPGIEGSFDGHTEPHRE